MQLATYFLFILAFSHTKGVLVKLSSGRVLGGEPDVNAPRNTAGIFNKNLNHVCSGALIHPSWVLTSVLCAQITNVYDMRVIIGKPFTNTTYETAIKIKKYIVYPNFDSTNLTDDIALIELEKPADNNTEVLDILNFDLDLSNVTATIKGYGFYETADTDVYPGNLTQRDLKIVSNSYCSNYPIVISNKKLCSDYIACNGDEGAPLILADTNELAGIVSKKHGRNICGFEAVPLTLYTKVLPYKKWIQTTANINL